MKNVRGDISSHIKKRVEKQCETHKWKKWGCIGADVCDVDERTGSIRRAYRQINSKPTG
jgi:hypothetical protein